MGSGTRVAQGSGEKWLDLGYTCFPLHLLGSQLEEANIWVSSWDKTRMFLYQDKCKLMVEFGIRAARFKAVYFVSLTMHLLSMVRTNSTPDKGIISLSWRVKHRGI